MTNWIICLTRNNLHLTRKALPTFVAQDIGNPCVLFIDNASTDGTHEWMKSLGGSGYGSVFLSKRLSVAAGWNYVLEGAFDNGADYALVVNNDVELRPDTYRLLVSDEGPFVTGVGVDDRSKIEPPYLPPNPQAKRPHPDFSCFLIRRECWQEVGPFDEQFEGAFFEDNDYHVRMHKAGIRAVSIDLPFYHVGSATIKNADPKERALISQTAGRNRERFFAKWGCYPGTPEYEALFTEAAE